jgi:large subunit ribosomal protein L35
MKTKKAITKRFKITKNGKIMRRAVGRNHFLAKKSGKQRRKSRKWVEVSKEQARRIKKY